MIKINFLIGVCIFNYSCCAIVRDPFFYSSKNYENITCKAIGKVDQTKFAIIFYNGELKAVKEGSQIGKTTIIEIWNDKIVVQDNQFNKSLIKLDK